ncbi:MAG: prenyltransferase [Methanophagales archaeon]|nr:prenyltransferase [Methanophagales archaeon]
MEFDTIFKIVKLGRLHMLTIGLLLFVMGALFAVLSGAAFLLNRFIVGYAILLSAHLSVHYSNDYFDTDADRYSKTTLFTGGTRVLLENPELCRFSKWFALFLMGVSLILALLFSILFSFSVLFLLFVLIGNLVGWYYAAPPVRLAYRGLGEIATMVIFGLMVPGLGYLVLMERFTRGFLIFVFPFMLYGLALIIAVQIPDMESDHLGNKNTVIVRKGRRFGFLVIGFLLSLATLSFLLTSLINWLPAVIDLRVIALLSLLPLSLGIQGLLTQPTERAPATKLVTSALSSTLLFIFMINCYFLLLVNY